MLFSCFFIYFHFLNMCLTLTSTGCSFASVSSRVVSLLAGSGGGISSSVSTYHHCHEQYSVHPRDTRQNQRAEQDRRWMVRETSRYTLLFFFFPPFFFFFSFVYYIWLIGIMLCFSCSSSAVINVVTSKGRTTTMKKSTCFKMTLWLVTYNEFYVKQVSQIFFYLCFP